MRNESWTDKHYAFFTNRECEYFPCHPTVDPDNFNCLFCYCPLYILGENCGGNFEYLPGGIKNCAHCTFPHQRQNYGRIISRYTEILATLSARQPPSDAAPGSLSSS